MAAGFKEVEISDPGKLDDFISGTTGSIMAVLTVSIRLYKFLLSTHSNITVLTIL